jgi:hypothetical protein
VAQVVAASNHRVTNLLFTVSFEGTSSTDAPVYVRVLKQTTAGTSSALTLVKDCDADDETLQTTAIHSAIVEPTASDVKYAQFIHPQGGARDIGPFSVPGGQRMGVEVTVAVGVDCIVSFRGEE